jgi:hypothetical protein
MMPPTRIEQLNNFQDAVQSPDGLDRLRALQAVEQALPSSQGLMGMPQVQAPMPMVPRQYGGEVGTGGLVEVLDDGTQVFDSSQEGILNRSLHGGMLQGQTQTTSAPSGFSGGPTAAGTLASGTSAPSGFTISTGQDKYGNTIGDLTGTQDYYDLNFAARDAGQDTFMYGDKLMQVDPGYLRGGGINPFISNRLSEDMITNPQNYTSGGLGGGSINLSTVQRKPDITDPSFYSLPSNTPTEDFSRDISGQYDSYYEANKAALEAGSPTFMYGSKLAKTDPGLLPDYVGGIKPFISNAVPEKYISAGVQLPPGWANMSAQQLAMAQPGGPQFYTDAGVPGRYLGRGVYQYGNSGGQINSLQGGGQIISKQYGGEIGTGGLVDILDDGTQVFDKTEEGILNRSLHGGMLQGQQQTATAPSSFSGGTDAPGTLASGTSSTTPAVLPKDLSGVDNAALSPLLSMPSVQDRGGVYNASEIRDAGIDLNRPNDAPETIISSSGAQTKYRDPRTGKIPYDLYVAPAVNTFGQGYDLKDVDYFTANALALSEGADRFIYNDEYAAVDPGLLSNYNYTKLGTKPYAAPVGPIEGVSYSGVSTGRGGSYSNLPQNPNSPAAMKAKGYKYPGRGLPPVYVGIPEYTPVRYRADGGQIDPSQAAQGLASFGRYGDNILVHMNPEELQGLASLGQITYNPVTGLPEAFSLKGLFKGIRKLAPVAAMIAAPFVLGPSGLGIFSKGFLGSALGAASAGGIGSFVGNLIAGAKPKDALKQGLTSAVLSGGLAYLGGAPLTGGATPPKAIPTSGQKLLSKTMTGDIPSYGGKLVQPASQFSGGAANIGKTVTSLDPMRQQAFQLQPKAYGVTPQIQSGQAMTAPQLQNIITEGQAGANKLYEGARASNLSFNQAQAQPANILERVQQSPLMTDPVGSLKNIGSQIGDQLSTTKGLTRAIGYDLMTPDWEAQYAAEAAAKEQQLQDAGYTVDTGFGGQTVIRDSSGVQMPRTLTVQQILDRALGKTPRTKLVADYRYGPSGAKEGGLVSLKHGGEFSGMVPGEGHGMEDNVYMPIVEKGHGKQVGTLAVSPSEYVVDSYTMAALGNGNADAGAKVMDRVVKNVRKKAYGDTEQPNEISGLEALKPMMERV